MAHDKGRSKRDELLNPEDERLSEWSRARREQRFWHRERRDVRRLLEAAEHHDLTAAQQVTADAWKTTKAELLSRESFAPVFFLTVVVAVATPVIDTTKFGRFIILLGMVAALLLALQRSLLYRRNFIRLGWVMVVALALTAASLIALSHDRDAWRLQAIVAVLYVIVIVVALPAILIRTLLHPKVTLNTLAGVMTAYLFIGLMFTGVFRFIDAVTEGEFFAQEGQTEPGDFEYFSFITITTTGYGDLTPGNQAARTAAMAEAVTGQIFLVTVVARVVAMFGQTRGGRLSLDDGPPPTPDGDPGGHGADGPPGASLDDLIDPPAGTDDRAP